VRYVPVEHGMAGYGLTGVSGSGRIRGGTVGHNLVWYGLGF
jgi:hypothetical protein